jgi:hypothetical protein
MIPVGVVVRSSRRHPRLVRRALAWSTLAAVAPGLWACTDRTLEPPGLIAQQSEKGRITLSVNRNVDLLFLVDNSQSMGLSQDNLLRNFPGFMTALEGLPGGLPNVHIAVVSSDMGAGDGQSIDKCGAGGTGDRGVFRFTPRGTCTATGLDPNATYISDIAGVRNYTGALRDVFTCIAALGEKEGCGFEHQFASITRALGADGQPPPIENQGFLRDDAYLAIILITNEDDCSAPPNSLLFDSTANRRLADQLGPLANFRCNEFGHVCDGARPGRLAPGNDATATQTYDQCVPAEDGILLGVADTAARIKALKPGAADKIVVAAITAPPTSPQAPYTVHWEPNKLMPPDSGPWPVISHACTAPDTSFADPAPRILQFVNEFGGNGLSMSICGGEFSSALSGIADLIGRKLTPPCIEGTIAKRPGTDRDDCTVIGSKSAGNGSSADSTIAACTDTGDVGPCWRLIPGTGTCTGRMIEVVPGPDGPSASGETAAVECSLCAPGMPDPARGCP